MRAVAYVRVSSMSQLDGHSLDAQERLFKELCKNRRWEPVRIYREEGKSAHVEAISRRPAFRQLLDDASKDQFDVVVVHTLDRWSRNQRVMLESFSTLAKHNVSLVSITEQIDYSTPQGKLFTQMLRLSTVFLFSGWPIQGPLEEDLLLLFVNKEIFCVETKAPVILEPGFPCLFEGFGTPYLCPCPVIEDDVFVEELGDSIYVVLIPCLVPSRQYINNLFLCKHHKNPLLKRFWIYANCLPQKLYHILG